MIPPRRGLLSRWMLGLTASLSCTTQPVAASPAIDGVLILDPARRAQILAQRQKKSAARADEPSSPFLPRRLDGLVYRSGGENAYWVDGQRRFAHDPSPFGEVTRITPEAVKVGPLQLKPGQILNPASQTIEDLLPPGAITAEGRR